MAALTRRHYELFAILAITLSVGLIVAGLIVFLADMPGELSAIAALGSVAASSASWYFNRCADSLYQQERMWGSWMRRPM
jgi:hypothetical protein